MYDNSLDAVKEQLSRDMYKFNKCELKLPHNYDSLSRDIEYDKLDINDIIDSIFIKDFKLQNYESYPAINVKMLERNE